MVGRGRVARLMNALGLAAVTRERSIRTTKPADLGARPADLVERTGRPRLYRRPYAESARPDSVT